MCGHKQFGIWEVSKITVVDSNVVKKNLDFFYRFFFKLNSMVPNSAGIKVQQSTAV